MQLKTIFNRVTNNKPFVVDRVELVDDPPPQPTIVAGENQVNVRYAARLCGPLRRVSQHRYLTRFRQWIPDPRIGDDRPHCIGVAHPWQT